MKSSVSYQKLIWKTRSSCEMAGNGVKSLPVRCDVEDLVILPLIVHDHGCDIHQSPGGSSQRPGSCRCPGLAFGADRQLLPPIGDLTDHSKC